jgi:hypothetical protein
MPLADGRFGVCRVLRENTEEERKGHGCPRVLVAACSWIGVAAPELGEPKLREIHQLTHHSWNDPNVSWVSEPPPELFQRLGVIEPTAAEAVMKCAASGGWFFAGQLFLQWRWDHDREAVLREDQEYAEKQARAYEQAEKQRRQRLNSLDLKTLKNKRRFEDWKGYVPATAIKACRAIFREAVEALLALGPKPKKQAVLAVLKMCVQRLNKLDAEHDHFVETTVAEDLCGQIDDLAHASGLRNEENVADRWRDW